MSEHVEVFKIDVIDRIPEFDKLGLVKFFEYPCLVTFDEFKVGDLAAYIPPDFVVPDKPEYAFLGSKRRIKAKRLRGVVSQGLVVKAPRGSAVGDDVTEKMGIVKYVPRAKGMGGYGTGSKSQKFWKYSDFEKGPPIEGPYYDIESWYRYSHVFEEGELVEVTEKIHGTNARFTWQKGRLWIASRSGYRRSVHNLTIWQKLGQWLGFLKISSQSIYWQAVDQNLWIKGLCRTYPKYVFYGEIYGDVQDLTYGSRPGELKIRLFDVFVAPKFLDYTQRDMIGGYNDLIAPIIYSGPYSKDKIQELISGPSTIPGANHLREGIVIKPMVERYTKFGRVILKAVCPKYLERSK